MSSVTVLLSGSREGRRSVKLCLSRSDIQARLLHGRRNPRRIHRARCTSIVTAPSVGLPGWDVGLVSSLNLCNAVSLSTESHQSSGTGQSCAVRSNAVTGPSANSSKRLGGSEALRNIGFERTLHFTQLEGASV